MGIMRPTVNGGFSICNAKDENIGRYRCNHVLCTCSDNAKQVMDVLHKKGDAYLVGGCVRDIALNKPPHDEDICTNLTPDKVTKLFKSKGYKVIPTGEKHGTVTVMVNGEGYEITTYRQESGYADGRHPDDVEFVGTAEEDSNRRDFTFNAMYYDGDSVLDPHNGIKDIKNKIIRCVGNADDRFNEDALRMMRAVRFSSTLGFKIGKKELNSIKKNKEKINMISKERIKTEFDKLLSGKDKTKALRTMQKTGLLKEVLPELDTLKSVKQHNKYHKYDAFEHTMKALENCKSDDTVVLWATMLHDIGKAECVTVDDKGYEHYYGHPEKSAEMANTICRRLKFSNTERKRIVDLVACHEASMGSKRKSAAKFVVNNQRLSDKDFKDLQIIWYADRKAHKDTNCDDINKMCANLNDILSKPHRIKQLSINGNDVKAEGLKDEDIGDCLNSVLRQAISNDTNDREKLLSFVRSYKKNKKI